MLRNVSCQHLFAFSTGVMNRNFSRGREVALARYLPCLSSFSVYTNVPSTFLTNSLSLSTLVMMFLVLHQPKDLSLSGPPPSCMGPERQLHEEGEPAEAVGLQQDLVRAGQDILRKVTEGTEDVVFACQYMRQEVYLVTLVEV